MLFLLLVVGALATPPPTIPTPYPTITPAPKSTCAYKDDDQGPFALDCLQAQFVARGCRATGHSYPTETNLDDADGSQMDKPWYNQQNWKAAMDAIDALAAVGGVDCRGDPTDIPTADPTESPVSNFPTPSPTVRTTTNTPAPTYNEGDEEGFKQLIGEAATGEAITDTDLKNACQPVFDRQYDDQEYVVIVEQGDKRSYYTVAGGDEICDMFESPDDALVGNRVSGPFQAITDGTFTRVHADGTAHLDWSPDAAAADTKVYVTAKRTNPSCREIVTPWSNDSDMTIDSSQFFCRDNSDACSGNAADSRKIAMALANRMMEDCSSDVVYTVDDSGSFTWNDSNSCWDSTSVAEPVYVSAMRGMLCTKRCTDITNQVYDSATESCWSVEAAAAGVGTCTNGSAASISSPEENTMAATMCNGAKCYLGSTDTFGTANAAWADGKSVDFVYFKNDSEIQFDKTSGVTQLFMNANGRWEYNDNSESFATLCRENSDNDDVQRKKNVATDCAINSQANNFGDTVAQFPSLNQGESGFEDPTQPGVLSIGIDVPQVLFDVSITFENSTSDAAEYTVSRSDSRWAVTGHDAADCSSSALYKLSVPWTVFNMGGAGGVDRLVSYQTSATSGSLDADTNVASDGSNSKFVFGTTMKVSARQPINLVVDNRASETVNVNQARQAVWYRSVTVRIPMIVTFQKTVTVTTATDIVSTKFNYKTVAAIIQSVQYDTQYFQPPYAKLKIRIRTKSQYPYMLNAQVDRHVLSVGSVEDSTAATVDLQLTHIADDANCTFTNPDHMREGDICVQEWDLDITPQENVCYATGEYTITYETSCFYGKEVCYMPVDDNDEELTTVSFTFKIQTSKFCPSVADQIELEGTLAVTGRESFKPTEEGVEGPTPGGWYIQGETVHVFGTTSSSRAKIINTNVLMIEVHQVLSGLIQTGFKRVPFDPTTEEIVVWTPAGTDRLATGTVNVDAGDGAEAIEIIKDNEVYASGHDFGGAYSFSATECGFKVLLHAKLFPVNADSFANKKLVVTMQVQYEAIGTGGGRRRRLVSGSVHDSSVETEFELRPWQPKKLPSGLKGVASMKMVMSVQKGLVTRANAFQFSQGWKNAVVTGLSRNASGKRVYPEQVSVDAIYSGKSKIWERSMNQGFDNRRLQVGTAQKLAIEFTFADVEYKNAMPLYELIELFQEQLMLPASPLMSQPVFRSSVIHELEAIKTSDYRPSIVHDDLESTTKLASSAMIATPFVALMTLFLALF